MSTTKLTRAEACAELARRLGCTVYRWQAYSYMVQQSNLGALSLEALPCPPPLHCAPPLPNDDPLYYVPDFFTSRDAAAELVAWIYETQSYDTLCKFIEMLCEVGHVDIDDKLAYKVTKLLTASAEAQTLAACAALGLEVEDVK